GGRGPPAGPAPRRREAARADFVVVNDGDPAALPAKAAALLADLRAGLGRRLPSEPPWRY
ncbi:MAG TPA: hypothetical protein VLD85_02755, partial [Anaeromyxobacteraceae bacterium]|nr:hypothetical protein [Anaeromyxobacteraceae bacterium]